MKKNIVIVILTVLTLISWIYAYSQKLRAEHAEQEALKNMTIATEQAEIARIEKLAADSARVIAELNKKLAERTMEIAEEQRVLAEQRLKLLEQSK